MFNVCHRLSKRESLANERVRFNNNNNILKMLYTYYYWRYIFIKYNNIIYVIIGDARAQTFLLRTAARHVGKYDVLITWTYLLVPTYIMIILCT